MEQLLGSERRSAEFVALCHDLRQFVIAGHLLADIPEQVALTDDIRERFTLLKSNFDHAATLLDSVINQQVDQRRVDLAMLATDVAALYSVHHTISVEWDGKPVWATCSVVHVRRAIGNLVDNAIRAVNGEGAVVLRLGHQDGDPYVEVQDDGPGFGRIPPADGWGLQVVSSAAGRCDARVTVDSEPERGTTVRLTLPPGN